MSSLPSRDRLVVPPFCLISSMIFGEMFSVEIHASDVRSHVEFY